VKTGRTPSQPTLRVLRPRPTVRWRLTLLYGLIFLSCGAALLAITYWLFANFAYSPPKEPTNPIMLQLETAMSIVRSNGLHRLQLYSGIALAIMAIVSVVLGWLVAGRVLAPLRTITATADRISDTNLHERLAVSGPRDELRLLADTIDRLLARLETSFDAQRRFVANASHELRTPLAMMRTTLDVAIAKPGGVPAQSRELDTELRVDLDHADQLLESFLTLARAKTASSRNATTSRSSRSSAPRSATAPTRSPPRN
jgi:signal transduction histidine kinase